MLFSRIISNTKKEDPVLCFMTLRQGLVNNYRQHYSALPGLPWRHEGEECNSCYQFQLYMDAFISSKSCPLLRKLHQHLFMLIVGVPTITQILSGQLFYLFICLSFLSIDESKIFEGTDYTLRFFSLHLLKNVSQHLLKEGDTV